MLDSPGCIPKPNLKQGNHSHMHFVYQYLTSYNAGTKRIKNIYRNTLWQKKFSTETEWWKLNETPCGQRWLHCNNSINNRSNGQWSWQYEHTAWSHQRWSHHFLWLTGVSPLAGLVLSSLYCHTCRRWLSTIAKNWDSLLTSPVPVSGGQVIQSWGVLGQTELSWHGCAHMPNIGPSVTSVCFTCQATVQHDHLSSFNPTMQPFSNFKYWWCCTICLRGILRFCRLDGNQIKLTYPWKLDHSYCVQNLLQ